MRTWKYVLFDFSVSHSLFVIIRLLDYDKFYSFSDEDCKQHKCWSLSKKVRIGTSTMRLQTIFAGKISIDEQ